MDALEWMTRQKLYGAVWSTPMLVFSKRFELSKVGLAKVCSRRQNPRARGAGHRRCALFRTGAVEQA